MTAVQLIEELQHYKEELLQIMDGFGRGSGTYMIDRDDDPRYRAFVIELCDLLNDCLGSNKYSQLINQHFNQGLHNEFRTPNYASVRNITAVIDSVITRAQRHPDAFIHEPEPEAQPTLEPTELKTQQIEFPDKITLQWVWNHVPARFLWSLVGVVVAAFFLGIAFGQTSLYKSLLVKETAKTTMETSVKAENP